jgi:5'-methylthioadenosine phosphorylase
LGFAILISRNHGSVFSMQAEIGIIGGTGLYDPKLLKNIQEIEVNTPYGTPSDTFIVGELSGRKVAFLARHGRKHTIRPTDVNSRANIYALKKLGVQQILAVSTVGSLKEEYKPGELAFVDQFIDRTTKREQSFYTQEQVCHISVADPMCPQIRKTLIAVAKAAKIYAHPTATYVCIEGPRFSTKAESKLFQQWGADLVGMTLVPECVLAREAELCYASIATVTDYDCWKDHPVTTEEILTTMKANIEKVKTILTNTITKLPKEHDCDCKYALKNALV